MTTQDHAEIARIAREIVRITSGRTGARGMSLKGGLAEVPALVALLARDPASNVSGLPAAIFGDVRVAMRNAASVLGECWANEAHEMLEDEQIARDARGALEDATAAFYAGIARNDWRAVAKYATEIAECRETIARFDCVKASEAFQRCGFAAPE
jgi:hypothetical protein